MVILIHSSKTMRSPTRPVEVPYRAPALLSHTERLGTYLKTLSVQDIQKSMHVSGALAAKTHDLIADWTTEPSVQSLAIDSFAGDIYSGLQANEFSAADRDYADGVLRILSGLYGIIRPYDSIHPYRLEMGYRFPDPTYHNLYAFWSDVIAKCLPDTGPIIDLSAVEYSKTITPFVDPERIIAPRFLTVHPVSGEPTFVVVHTKIARGAFAKWLIQNRITSPAALPDFNALGYRYDPGLSTPAVPVFICKAFGGLGLSVRLLP